jgi:alanine racemase
MAMADVSHIPDVEPGDEVVVLGQQGSECIGLDEFAESAGIIPHELLVRLSGRAPRVYLRGGVAVEQSEPLNAAEALQCASST